MIPRPAALTSFVFLAASELVLAQISAPICKSSWAWSYNSLNQNPCEVAAYLQATCDQGSFTIDPLPTGYYYTPGGDHIRNLCKCSSVVYNLLSACGVCQGDEMTSWSDFSSNCTETALPSTFPNPVPSGTRVQQWALIDTTRVNYWNETEAMIVGDAPEISPGALIGTGSSGSSTTTSSTSSTSSTGPSSSTISPTATTTTTPTPSPTSTKGSSSSKTGAIAGGVAGGIMAFVAIGGFIFFSLRRQRQQPPSAPFIVDDASPPTSAAPMRHVYRPMSDDGTTMHSQHSVPSAPRSPMKLYDPSNPATFPGYQGGPMPTPSLPMPAGNTLANMNTSGPQPLASGYHGLPTV